MKAEIIDKDKALSAALNSLGYSITSKNTEVFLHIAKLVKEKGLHVTLAELIEQRMCVEGLYEN